MESEVAASQPATESGIKPILGTTEVPMGSERVKVSWAEFTPDLSAEDKERFDPSKAIIYLTSWPFKSDQPIAHVLPRSLVARTKVRTFSIDTRVFNKTGPDTLYLEAQGIAAFLELLGINGATIVGHSEGAIRAINLATILEKKNPELVKGVVLMNPMGMDNRSLKELARDFITDVVKISGEERKRKGASSPKGLVMQFMQSLLRDVVFAGVNYPRVFKSQLENLVTVNPHLREIKAPVVIMAAARDLVSDLRQYTPSSTIEGVVSPQAEQELNELVDQKWDQLKFEDQAKYGSKEQYLALYRERQEMAALSRARQQYLKKEFFPEAEDVVFLVGTKYADHGGTHDSRHQKVAHIIYGIFDRLKRPKSI